MRDEVLGVAERRHEGGYRCQGVGGVLDDRHPLQEALRGQARREPRGPTGGQDVVGAGEVVPERHRREATDEHGPSVADPQGPLAGVDRDDLEVLRGPGVDDAQALVEVVDEDMGALP